MFWSHSTTSGISWKQDNISHNKTSKTAHNNTCSCTNFSTALRQSGCNKVMKKTPATVRITLSSDTLCFPLTKGDRFHVLRNETLLPVNLYYASKMCILFNLNCHDFYVFKVTLYLYYWYLHWKLILVSVMVLLVTINLEHQDPFYVLAWRIWEISWCGLMTGFCGPGDEPCNFIKAGNLLTKWQWKLYMKLNDYSLWRKCNSPCVGTVGVQDLNHNKCMQKVWCNHIWWERCVGLLEHYRNNVIAWKINIQL